MKQGGRTIVFDASVVVKLVIDEPLSDQTHSLLRQLFLQPGIHLCVPDLLYTECANVFWKYVNRGVFSEDEAHEFLSDVQGYSFDTIPVSDHLQKALELACKFQLSVYDACYLAVADLQDGILITEDRRLIAKTISLNIPVLEITEAQRSLFES